MKATVLFHSEAQLPTCVPTKHANACSAAPFQNYRIDDAFVSLRLWPNNSGRYGFHVEVADGSVVVSRVVEGTPADSGAPRLCEGDRIVTVNGVPMDGVERAEVVRLIREHGRVPCVPMSLIVRPKGQFQDPLRLSCSANCLVSVSMLFLNCSLETVRPPILNHDKVKELSTYSVHVASFEMLGPCLR